MSSIELVDKRQVTNGFKAFMAAVPGFVTAGIKVGDTDAPAAQSTDAAVFPPFVEVKRLPDGRDPQGGWNQPLNVQFAKYQVLYVGIDREASEGLADDGLAHFLEQESSPPRDYLQPMTVTDHAVIGRELVSDLGYVPSGRANGVLHHYRILVQRIV